MTTIFLIQPKTGNIGNQIIAAGMESLLREAFQGKVNLVSLPAATGSKGGLDAKMIYEVNRLADGLIIGPGNLFENGGLQCDNRALSALSVPSMLFSVSMAQIYDRRGRFANRSDSLADDKIQALCQLSDLVLVRDHATRNYLHQLGLKQAEVVGCPSIMLHSKELLLPESDPLALNSILISVRHPKLMSIPYSLQGKVRNDLRSLIRLCRDQLGAEVRLLCHDPEDLSYAAEYPDVTPLYTENIGRFLGWLRDCRMNLTFRLHSFVPAVSLGRPVLHFSYDQRALNLIQTLGIQKWDINFVETPDLASAVQARLQAGNLPRPDDSDFSPVWNPLKSQMSLHMGNFASLVREYQSTQKY